MSRHITKICLLLTALPVILSPSAVAWTPYGYGPYGPGYHNGHPGTEQPAGLPTTNENYESAIPPSSDPTGRYGHQWDYPYGTWTPGSPYGLQAPATTPPEQTYPGYGPWSAPSWGYPGSGSRGFGRPPGFRISRATSNDAYTVDIELSGMKPEEVQIRTEGQRLIISRERSEQQVQKDSFDGGRGFMRRFSYSSGTTSRRLSVPGDGDLSAMSREDSDGGIHIRIPRRSTSLPPGQN